MLRFCNNGLKFQRPILQSKGITENQTRYLFSRQRLGIQKFEDVRGDVSGFWDKNKVKFKENFKIEYLYEGCNFAKFENGLKDYLYVMNNDAHDVNILRRALDLLIKKQNEYKGRGKYNFGTVIMRAFHFLDMPKEALEFFENKDVRKLFIEVTAHQILLDLLYEHKRYADVLHVYQNLSEKDQPLTNKYITVFVFASYFQLNTPESLKESYELWNKLTPKQKKIQFRKSRTFIAGLALKQHQPKLALEVLKDDEKYFYVTIRHIRLLAWAETGQFDKVLEMFQAIVQQHKENMIHKTSIELLDNIEKLFKENGSEKDIDDFCAGRKEIESLDLTTKEALEEMLTSQFPDISPPNLSKKNRN